MAESGPVRELCLLKRAVKALIRESPHGLTRHEICRHLRQRSDIKGTYRNIVLLSSSVLDMLLKERKIGCRVEGRSKIYFFVGDSRCVT